MSKIIVAKDFSRFPAGRFISDGRFSGERFRDELLIPALDKTTTVVTVVLDGAMGYPSSFIEEVFGGLVRMGYRSEYLKKRMRIEATGAFEIYALEAWKEISLQDDCVKKS